MAEQPAARPRLRQQDVQAAGHFNQTWQVQLPEAATFDDLLRAEFWADCAYRFYGEKPDSGKGYLDRIEVRQPSSGLYAAFLITGIGKGYLQVKQIEMVKPVEVDIAADSPLTTRWNVAKRCHEVVRRGPQGAALEVMSSGHQTKTDAATWIVRHYEKLKPLAA